MTLAQGFSIGANVADRRKAARAQAQQRNQELQIHGYSFDDKNQLAVRSGSKAEADQLQALEATQLAKGLQAKLYAQTTDAAFEDFAATGDASYLQNTLAREPELAEIWKQQGVHNIANIDYQKDTSLLNKAGIRPAMYDTPEKQDIVNKSLYKVYDGKKWNIGSANKAMSESGSMNRLGKRKAQDANTNHKNFVDLVQGPKGSTWHHKGHKYEDLILSASDKYDVPPNLIAAMMKQESNNNPDAVSPVGAGGLMQIMEPTAKDLGVTDRFDPKQSIEGGTKYMAQLLKRYKGDVKLALAAYNGGMGNVDKYGGIPPFKETKDYVKKIMSNFDIAETYDGGTADETAELIKGQYADPVDTILQHRRDIANADRGTTSSLEDRKVAQIDRQQDQKDVDLALDAQGNDLKQQQIIAKLRTEGSTATQKDLAAAANSTDSLLQQFGGEDQFFQADFSDQKTYNKAYREIVKIERLEGTKLTPADKKSITDIRQLLALGGPGSELSASQTGLLDSTLSNAKQYVSDNVKGAEAKSAYAAFRNSVRNALFGSALTEAEIKSFDEAYGKLGKKLGPVLQSFQTALSQVEAKLDSTANLMNPYSAKVRLGADQDKLEVVKTSLQQRIDYLQGLQAGEPTARQDQGKTGFATKTVDPQAPDLNTLF